MKQKKAQPTLLWEAWREHALSRPERDAIVHWRVGEAPVRLSWRELLAQAETLAEKLATLGVKDRAVCGIMFKHHPAFYPTYLAVCALGAIPSVLAWPTPRLHPDKFRSGIEGMARTSGMHWILTEAEFVPVLTPLLGPHSSLKGVFDLFDEVIPKATAPKLWSNTDSSTTVLLQHSSGTTGLQKAVALSHRSVIAQLEAYADALKIEENDKIVSWLPHYHDMGLIAAFHLPLLLGIPLIQLDPFEWITVPGALLEAMYAEKATLAWMPNFAFKFMADRTDLEELKFKHLPVRKIVNCSEPVTHDSMSAFSDRFGFLGLTMERLGSCYAMAESTFAVSQSTVGEPPTTLRVEIESLSRGRVVETNQREGSRLLLSSGRLLSGTRLEIRTETGEARPEGNVGEIWVQSTSLFTGYHGNSELSASALKEGWYRTKDLGFQFRGEIYVLGRLDDVIIVAGKNLYPQDIESAVGEIPGVVPGRVVAFGIEDPMTATARVGVIAETAETSEAAREIIRRGIQKVGMEIGVTLSDIHLVEPRWLIKSSSGKLSRRANKERILATPVQEKRAHDK